MKFKAKHGLLPAIAMLLISAIALSSASYAWFTMSRTVTATGIELTALAPANLRISNAEGGTYAETTALTMSFTGSGDKLYKLMPVSSKDGLKFFAAGNILMADNGAANATTVFTLVGDPAAGDPIDGKISDARDGYYADFNLWLKTTGEEDVYVTLSTTLTSIKMKTAESTSQLHKAVRVAILDGAGTAKLTETGSNPYIYADGSAATYFTGVTGAVTAAGAGQNAGEAVSFIGANPAAGETATALFKVTGGSAGDGNTPVKITVRVWIEGQDARCITANNTDAFQITLGFKDITFAEA